MSIQPTTINRYYVFLASPGDMGNERQQVRDFFKHYNHSNARHRNLEFMVIDWENYSTIGVGEPQALINRDTLLKYKDNLALVIGLLGQRFGTPTNNAESGTEEEFQIALALRQEDGEFPEIKWFFRENWGTSGAPTAPDKMIEAAAQMKKVEAFKQEMRNGDTKMLYADFNDTTDFSTILNHDLEAWLNDPSHPWNEIPIPPSVPESNITPADPNAALWLNSYQRSLSLECEQLPLEKLGEHTTPITLSQVHIALNVVRPPERSDKGDPETQELLARQMDRGEGADVQQILLCLAEQPRAVLVGGPGSGKSALVDYITTQLINPNEDAPLPKTLQNLIPVRLVLRQIPSVEEPSNGEWLWQALESDVRTRLKPVGDKEAVARAKAVTRLLRTNIDDGPGLFFLLDGLDEVTAATGKRDHLIEAVRAFASVLPSRHRLLLTARPYAYADSAWQLPGVPHFVLAPMDKALRAEFIQRWHLEGAPHKGWTENEAEARAEKLIRTVESNSHLRELAQRPLHATLIALLSLRGRLPRDRAELYENAINLLIDRWRSGESAFCGCDGKPVDIPDLALRQALQQLACDMHRKQRSEGNQVDAADILQARLMEALRPIIDEHGIRRDDLLAWLREHTGILVARTDDRFAFPHRAFQEHLAMSWLAAGSSEAPVASQVAKDPLWWREVFLLAVGSERDTPRNGVLHVHELLNLRPNGREVIERRARMSVLAGLGLLELELGQENFETERNMAKGGLVSLIETPGLLGAQERAEAGRVLAHLGDPRPGVGCKLDPKSKLLLPDFEWIKHPTCRF
ncbi:MAG: NACHT domain-containing protein, partial [Gammaproteobacteria bacterium]|nr:NACHT domain-containing protein [Gammaproteobacteria bacterium]